LLELKPAPPPLANPCAHIESTLLGFSVGCPWAGELFTERKVEDKAIATA
jgi:hypothetical protein